MKSNNDSDEIPDISDLEEKISLQIQESVNNIFNSSNFNNQNIGLPEDLTTNDSQLMNKVNDLRENNSNFNHIIEKVNEIKDENVNTAIHYEKSGSLQFFEIQESFFKEHNSNSTINENSKENTQRIHRQQESSLQNTVNFSKSQPTQLSNRSDPNHINLNETNFMQTTTQESEYPMLDSNTDELEFTNHTNLKQKVLNLQGQLKTFYMGNVIKEQLNYLQDNTDLSRSTPKNFANNTQEIDFMNTTPLSQHKKQKSEDIEAPKNGFNNIQKDRILEIKNSPTNSKPKSVSSYLLQLNNTSTEINQKNSNNTSLASNNVDISRNHNNFHINSTLINSADKIYRNNVKKVYSEFHQPKNNVNYASEKKLYDSKSDQNLKHFENSIAEENSEASENRRQVVFENWTIDKIREKLPSPKADATFIIAPQNRNLNTKKFRDCSKSSKYKKSEGSQSPTMNKSVMQPKMLDHKNYDSRSYNLRHKESKTMNKSTEHNPNVMSKKNSKTKIANWVNKDGKSNQQICKAVAVEELLDINKSSKSKRGRLNDVLGKINNSSSNNSKKNEHTTNSVSAKKKPLKASHHIRNYINMHQENKTLNLNRLNESDEGLSVNNSQSNHHENIQAMNSSGNSPNVYCDQNKTPLQNQTQNQNISGSIIITTEIDIESTNSEPKKLPTEANFVNYKLKNWITSEEPPQNHQAFEDNPRLYKYATFGLHENSQSNHFTNTKIEEKDENIESPRELIYQQYQISDQEYIKNNFININSNTESSNLEVGKNEQMLEHKESHGYIESSRYSDGNLIDVNSPNEEYGEVNEKSKVSQSNNLEDLNIECNPMLIWKNKQDIKLINEKNNGRLIFNTELAKIVSKAKSQEPYEQIDVNVEKNLLSEDFKDEGTLLEDYQSHIMMTDTRRIAMTSEDTSSNQKVLQTADRAFFDTNSKSKQNNNQSSEKKQTQLVNSYLSDRNQSQNTRKKITGSNLKTDINKKQVLDNDVIKKQYSQNNKRLSKGERKKSSLTENKEKRDSISPQPTNETFNSINIQKPEDNNQSYLSIKETYLNYKNNLESNDQYASEEMTSTDQINTAKPMTSILMKSPGYYNSYIQKTGKKYIEKNKSFLDSNKKDKKSPSLNKIQSNFIKDTIRESEHSNYNQSYILTESNDEKLENFKLNKKSFQSLNHLHDSQNDIANSQNDAIKMSSRSRLSYTKTKPDKKNPGLKMYEYAMQKDQIKKLMMEEMDQVRNNKELEECTFKPQLLTKTKSNVKTRTFSRKSQDDSTKSHRKNSSKYSFSEISIKPHYNTHDDDSQFIDKSMNMDRSINIERSFFKVRDQEFERPKPIVKPTPKNEWNSSNKKHNLLEQRNMSLEKSTNKKKENILEKVERNNEEKNKSIEKKVFRHPKVKEKGDIVSFLNRNQLEISNNFSRINTKLKKIDNSIKINKKPFGKSVDQKAQRSSITENNKNNKLLKKFEPTKIVSNKQKQVDISSEKKVETASEKNIKLKTFEDTSKLSKVDTGFFESFNKNRDDKFDFEKLKEEVLKFAGNENKAQKVVAPSTITARRLKTLDF